MAYRHWVLFLLLLVYIHCLLCRMLPAFLVSVPIPGCEIVCAGVDSVPLCHKTSGWQRDGGSSGSDDPDFLACQECRAGIGDPHAEGANGNFFSMRDGACIGKKEYGLLMGYGFALPFVLGSFVTMKVVDRMNRKVSLAIALFCWSLASGLMSLASSFWPLLLCRFWLGAAEAFVVPAALSLITQYFSEGSRASAASLLSAGVCLGAGVASFGVPLAQHVGWQQTCALVGVVGVALAFLVFGTIEEPERTQEGERKSALKQVTFSTKVSPPPARPVSGIKPVVWVLTAATSLRLAASYTIAAFLPVYYLRAQLPGYSAATYATGNAVIVASAGLASAVCGGAAADHYNARCASAPIRIAGTMQVCAIIFFVGVFKASTFLGSLMCYAVALLLGECWYGLSLVQVQSVVEPRVQGKTTTLVLSVATLLSNASPAIIGAIDPGTSQLGEVMMHLIACCLLLTALLFAVASRQVEAQADEEEQEEERRASLLEQDSQTSDEAAVASSVVKTGTSDETSSRRVSARPSLRDLRSSRRQSFAEAVVRQASRKLNHFHAPSASVDLMVAEFD